MRDRPQVAPAGRQSYLDYLTLMAPVALQYGGKEQLTLRSYSATPGTIASYRVEVTGSASALQLWGRTSEDQVASLPIAEQDGAVTFTGTITSEAGIPVEYTLFALADAYPVEQIATLPHGGVHLDTMLDYLMITTEALRPATECSASHHRKHSGLRV